MSPSILTTAGVTRKETSMRVNYREIKDNHLQIQFQSQFFHLLPL